MYGYRAQLYGAGWLTHASDDLKKIYNFQMMPQVRCKNQEKRVRDRFTPYFTDLYSVTYKSQATRMMPHFQDAS